MALQANSLGTQAVAAIEATRPGNAVGDVHQEALQRLTSIRVGSELQASILSRLNDGSFLVKVADGVARLNLPASAQVGDTLNLTLLATTPRLAFQLGNQAGANAVALGGTEQLVERFVQVEQNGKLASRADSALRQASLSATPSALPNASTEASAATAGGSAPTSLSATARLIGNVLQASEGADAAIVGKTALVNSPNAAPGQVAEALRNALGYSGVFYESHVAQWAQGERSAADLLREPQAKNAADGLAKNPGDAAKNNADGTPIATLNTDATRLINLQLDTLEHRRVAWQGELWPGQKLEWEVTEQAPRHTAPDSESTWQSTVRFELPTLGTVSATIQLRGDQVQMHVRTVDEATAKTLRNQQTGLAHALEAAGAALELLTVKVENP